MIPNWVIGLQIFSNLLEIIIIIGVGLFLKSYLPSYFEEKGKNLATKEDIEEITEKIEKVRSQYTSEIEILRSELGRQSHIHRLRFEKEFQVLSDVWRTLDDLSVKTWLLRPWVSTTPGPTENEAEKKEQRLQEWAKAYDAFRDEVMKNKPFYPKQVYEYLEAILKISRIEAYDYQLGSPIKGNPNLWEIGVRNGDAIIEAVDRVCEAIRGRIIQ